MWIVAVYFSVKDLTDPNYKYYFVSSYLKSHRYFFFLSVKSSVNFYISLLNILNVNSKYLFFSIKDPTDPNCKYSFASSYLKSHSYFFFLSLKNSVNFYNISWCLPIKKGINYYGTPLENSSQYWRLKVSGVKSIMY